MRQLKYHEKKLLRKVDFMNWEASNNLHENKILNRYKIQKREDYTAYNKLSREIREIANKIRDLNPKDPFRVRSSKLLIEKLYAMGLIPTKENLGLVDKVTASTFCRRRLPVVMKRLKMAESIKIAIKFIEQGHVRVGSELILDPAYFVPRTLEDFVTWKDTSKIRAHIQEYNDERDDYDFA